MLCKLPRLLPKQFVSTISAASFVPSTRLHASLILSGVKPSRRDKDPTCYGTNNTNSNVEIKTAFDLLQNANRLTLSAEFTNDDFDRRLTRTKKGRKSKKSIRPALMSTDGAHQVFGPQLLSCSPDCVETFSNNPLDCPVGLLVVDGIPDDVVQFPAAPSQAIC